MQVDPAVVVTGRGADVPVHRPAHRAPQDAQLGLDERVAVDPGAVLAAQLREHVDHRGIGAPLHVEAGPQLPRVVPEDRDVPLAAPVAGVGQRVEHRRRVALGRRQDGRGGLVPQAPVRVVQPGQPGPQVGDVDRPAREGHVPDRRRCGRPGHPLFYVSSDPAGRVRRVRRVRPRTREPDGS